MLTARVHHTSAHSPHCTKMDLDGEGHSPWGGMSTLCRLKHKNKINVCCRCPVASANQANGRGSFSVWRELRYANYALISSFQYILISTIEASINPKPMPTIDTSSTIQSVKSPTSRHPRTPRRAGQTPVRLEALDDSLGPLGPLGDNAPVPVDLPPAPPQKEQTATLNLRQPLSSTQSPLSRSMLDSVNLSEELEPYGGPRIPPPVQPSQGAPLRRDTQPSVSVEQAAKPSFDITVGDPHKVGDLTSSHIVYLVKTKVMPVN
jgi:hypothetical protein